MTVFTLRQWLRVEPFTLTMSSGFFSFFAHCGVISVLEEEGLFPAQITGSSSGAMMGAGWAAGCSAQRLRDFAFSLQKADFWDPGLGLGLLRGRLFRQLIGQIAPVTQMQHCPIPLAVSVYDLGGRRTVVARRGPLAKLVQASCAMPLFFQPVRINGRFYADGGIKDRPGLAGVAAGERVFYHHIASRSPWRRKNSPSLRVPERANMTTLVVPNLTRANPNRLENGRLAYNQARHALQAALDNPVGSIM